MHRSCTQALFFLRKVVLVLSLSRSIVLVHKQCSCTEVLSLYRSNVPVQEHCSCTEVLFMYALPQSGGGGQAHGMAATVSSSPHDNSDLKEGAKAGETMLPFWNQRVCQTDGTRIVKLRQMQSPVSLSLVF